MGIQDDDLLAATLDLLVFGVILVDSESRIVHANRVGARHLEEAQAVRRSAGRLSARTPASAVALRDGVERAARGGVLAETGIAVPIAGAGGRDLAAWVVPLHAHMCNGYSAFSATVAVFLREIGEPALLAGDLLMRRHRLTPAEIRVLTMLAQGMNPSETAGALGCALTTVRTHIKSLFTKTGTRCQADLMRLAMSSLAPASSAGRAYDGHGHGVQCERHRLGGTPSWPARPAAYAKDRIAALSAERHRA